MQDKTVEKLFLKQADYYAKSQTASQSPIVGLFLNWAKKFEGRRGRKTLVVGEFGGAGGALLAKLRESCRSPLALYNIELVKSFAKKQVSPKINFIHSSILKNNLCDEFFDCLIIRDVLHHLVGQNLQETLQNQKNALEQLNRLSKKDGTILVEELVNDSWVAAKLIYGLSRVNSYIGISSKFLEIDKNTIVSFLTAKELIKITEKIFGKRNIIKKFSRPANVKWQERLIHLGAKSRKFFLMIQK